jgi:hypothetical protein
VPPGLYDPKGGTGGGKMDNLCQGVDGVFLIAARASRVRESSPQESPFGNSHRAGKPPVGLQALRAD